MFDFVCLCVFFLKQKTAYEMRISDWSSDVCSSDLPFRQFPPDQLAMLVEQRRGQADLLRRAAHLDREAERLELALHRMGHLHHHFAGDGLLAADRLALVQARRGGAARRPQGVDPFLPRVGERKRGGSEKGRSVTVSFGGRGS